MTPSQRSEPVEQPLALRLLDHQIDSPDGTPVAKVDDIELVMVDGTLTATALLCGPGALGPRLPGRLGTWTTAIWRRLSLEQHPAPIRLSLTDVRSIGSSLTLTPEAANNAKDRLTLERWLGQHLIDRIPGSGAEPASEPAQRLRGSAPTVAPAQIRSAQTVLLSELCTYSAWAGDRLLGNVHEIIATQPNPANPVVGRLPVTRYVVGPRGVGSTMGYDRNPEHGPWILARPIIALHRDDVEVSADDLQDVDTAHRRISVRIPGAWR
jgi:hypothetical protein